MKPLVIWLVAATLILLMIPALAQDNPGLTIVIDKGSHASEMTLRPGVYVSVGLGAQAGGQEPRAYAVRITRVNGSVFNGTLELIRLDRNGELVRETSELEGAVGKAGMTSAPGVLTFHGTSPLTLTLEDGPLQPLMSSLEGHMTSTGFRLSWKPSSTELGDDKIGSYGVFAITTEERYQQAMAQYEEMSSYKKSLMTGEASSSDSLRKFIENYMQTTDRWLAEPQNDGLETIKSKARALFVKEKGLLADEPTDNSEATVIAMQIDAYYSQMDYIGSAMDKQDRYQRGAWNAVNAMFEYSPCVEGTSPRLDYGVAPGCEQLPALFAAAEERWHEVNQTLAKQYQRHQKAVAVLGCLRAAAHHLIEPRTGVPSYCETTELLP